MPNARTDLIVEPYTVSPSIPANSPEMGQVLQYVGGELSQVERIVNELADSVPHVVDAAPVSPRLSEIIYPISPYDPGSGSDRFYFWDGNSWDLLVPKFGQWTTFVSTLSAATGTFTSATTTMRYIKMGSLIILNGAVNITTNGTAAGHIQTTLPFNSSTLINHGLASGYDRVQNFVFGMRIDANSNVLRMYKYDGTYPGANGARLEYTTAYWSSDNS